MLLGAVRLTAAALLVALAGPADGSVLRALSVDDLRAGADAVVTGKVVRIRAVRSGGSIETVVTVRVSRTWHGAAARVVVLRIPGGIADGRRLVVPGTPTFERGQEVLLFLARDGSGWRPVGMFQGVWRLDPRRPGVALASTSGGAALIRSGTDTAAVDRRERRLHELVGRVGGGR